MVEQLSKPEAKQEIKTQVLALLRQTSESTFAKTDYSRLDAVFARHGCADVNACSQTLETAIERARLPIRQQLGGLLALVAALFLLCLNGSRRALKPGAAARVDVDATRDGAGFDSFKLFLLTGAILLLLAGVC